MLNTPTSSDGRQRLTLNARRVLTLLVHCCLKPSSCPQVLQDAWYWWGQALHSCPSKVVSLLLPVT